MFFNDDVEAFEDDMMTFLVIDGYHSGMERISELLKKFLSRFPDVQSLRELSPEGKQLTGADVYYGFIFSAERQQWDPEYGDRSAEYTAKTLAANQVIIEALTEIN